MAKQCKIMMVGCQNEEWNEQDQRRGKSGGKLPLCSNQTAPHSLPTLLSTCTAMAVAVLGTTYRGGLQIACLHARAGTLLATRWREAGSDGKEGKKKGGQETVGG